MVPPPYWELGFHRASEKGRAVWDGDEFYTKLEAYIDEMIGGGKLLVSRSLLPSGLDFYRPSLKDLCWRNIATVVVGICESGSEAGDSNGEKQDVN